MQKYNAQLVLDAHAVLGEGPVWDTEKRQLYWVDILQGQIHRFDPASGRDAQVLVGKTVGAVALRTNGGLVAALADGFYLIDSLDTPLSSKRLTSLDSVLFALCLPGDLLSGQRFNDGKCDPAGRFWAGTMQYDPENPRCALYRLESGGTCRNMVQGIGCSNGLAWSSDHKTMYYIDTTTRCVEMFDFDVGTGDLSNRRRLIDFSSREANTPGSPPAGFPDGMTIDAEGMLWVAEWAGFKVSRWDPATGRKIGEALLPVSRVSSCTFGGPDLSDLYITTAGEGISPAEKTEQPLWGGLFRAATDTRGIAPVRFAG